MPSVADEALVLKTVESGEADFIVHLLTRDRGRRSVFARNARKSFRRFSGALQPFAHVRIIVNLRRTQRLDGLSSAELIEPYLNLRQDLRRLALAGYYCELLDALLAEGETYPEVFELALFFLGRINQGEPSIKHRLFFELRLLDALGHRPDCLRCGEEGDELSGAAWFDPGRLGFLSDPSARFAGGAFQVSGPARIAMEQAMSLSLGELAALKLRRSEA